MVVALLNAKTTCNCWKHDPINPTQDRTPRQYSIWAGAMPSPEAINDEKKKLDPLDELSNISTLPCMALQLNCLQKNSWNSLESLEQTSSKRCGDVPCAPCCGVNYQLFGSVRKNALLDHWRRWWSIHFKLAELTSRCVLVRAACCAKPIGWKSRCLVALHWCKCAKLETADFGANSERDSNKREQENKSFWME